jgi:hypothetical protein
MPYGTYGATIDFGTGQFSNGIAANPCTFSTYDAAGNIISSGTFNSYSQASPRAEIGRGAALFRTSGYTPWRSRSRSEVQGRGKDGRLRELPDSWTLP